MSYRLMDRSIDLIRCDCNLSKMSKRDMLTRSSSGGVRKSDTVKDAKFFEFALGTPLVFNSPSTDSIPLTTTEQEELIISSIPESRHGTFSSGPSKWEDSYHVELKNESDRIIQSFQKDPVEGEFESSTLTAAPGAFEDNLSDRLGLGTLHPTQLTEKKDVIKNFVKRSFLQMLDSVLNST